MKSHAASLAGTAEVPQKADGIAAVPKTSASCGHCRGPVLSGEINYELSGSKEHQAGKHDKCVGPRSMNRRERIIQLVDASHFQALELNSMRASRHFCVGQYVAHR
jgi:hypothetical protein